MHKRKSISVVHYIKLFFLLLITLMVVGVLGLFFFSKMKSHLPVLGEPGHEVGSFEFLDQDGHRLTDKDVRGKVRVAEYFFTSCKSICPIMNENMQSVQSEFKNREDVIILSHTVDPDTDSPSRLKEYATRMHAIPGKWEFLTGSKMALYKMAQHDYLLSADTISIDNIESSFIHTQFISLVDKQNRIRGFYDATDKKEIEKLISDIKTIL